jgi:hypothetical protein
VLANPVVGRVDARRAELSLPVLAQRTPWSELEIEDEWVSGDSERAE